MGVLLLGIGDAIAILVFQIDIKIGGIVYQILPLHNP
jgi:hypothetical protein